MIPTWRKDARQETYAAPSCSLETRTTQMEFSRLEGKLDQVLGILASAFNWPCWESGASSAPRSNDTVDAVLSYLDPHASEFIPKDRQRELRFHARHCADTAARPAKPCNLSGRAAKAAEHPGVPLERTHTSIKSQSPVDATIERAVDKLGNANAEELVPANQPEMPAPESPESKSASNTQQEYSLACETVVSNIRSRLKASSCNGVADLAGHDNIGVTEQQVFAGLSREPLIFAAPSATPDTFAQKEESFDVEGTDDNRKKESDRRFFVRVQWPSYMELSFDDVWNYFAKFGGLSDIDWLDVENGFETMRLIYSSPVSAAGVMKHHKHNICRESDGKQIQVKVSVKYSDNPKHGFK